jgi:hypothetical protein
MKRGRPKKEPTRVVYRRVPESKYTEIIAQIEQLIKKYKSK